MFVRLWLTRSGFSRSLLLYFPLVRLAKITEAVNGSGECGLWMEWYLSQIEMRKHSMSIKELNWSGGSISALLPIFILNRLCLWVFVFLFCVVWCLTSSSQGFRMHYFQFNRAFKNKTGVGELAECKSEIIRIQRIFDFSRGWWAQC